MRIPLIRFANDNSPYAWWEWLFFPIIMPIVLVCLLVLVVASIPISYVLQRMKSIKDRNFRRQMQKSGRFINDEALRQNLLAGQGTLIVVQHSFKGPVHEWWTSDDIITDSPIELPSIHDDVESPDLVTFTHRCFSRYCNSESGIAQLSNGLDDQSRIRFSRVYRRAKAVTLYMWLGEESIMGCGHYRDKYGPFNFLDQYN